MFDPVLSPLFVVSALIIFFTYIFGCVQSEAMQTVAQVRTRNRKRRTRQPVPDSDPTEFNQTELDPQQTKITDYFSS